MIPKSLRIVLRDNSIRNVNLSIRLPVFLYHVFVVFMQRYHSPELLIRDVLISPSDTACEIQDRVSLILNQQRQRYIKRLVDFLFQYAKVFIIFAQFRIHVFHPIIAQLDIISAVMRLNVFQ